MRRKLNLLAAVAVTAVLGIAGAAIASVTYDPAEGGFVGKGDVQTLFNMNNKAAQDAAKNNLVSFSYDASVGYAFECEWWTGPAHNRSYHSNTRNVSIDVNSSVAFSDKKTGQYTGWFLNPIAIAGGSVAEPTDADCGAEGNEMKTIIAGSIVSIADPNGGLQVTYGGVTKPLPNTPVVVAAA